MKQLTQIQTWAAKVMTATHRNRTMAMRKREGSAD